MHRAAATDLLCLLYACAGTGRHQQATLVDMGVLSLTAAMLTRLPLEVLETLTPRDPLTTLVRLLYRVVSYCIAEYRRNEMMAARWLSCFIAHTCLVCPEDSPVPVVASATLTELLGHNQRLLEGACACPAAPVRPPPGAGVGNA
jgi:hypothetical protein